MLGFSLKTGLEEIKASEVHAKFIATIIKVSTDNQVFHILKGMAATLLQCHKKIFYLIATKTGLFKISCHQPFMLYILHSNIHVW